MPKHTVICTVGTSLLSNLGRLDGDDTKSNRALVRAYREKNWSEVAALLCQYLPTERVCGAEINSINDLLIDSHVEKGRLCLLPSDTTDGNNTATVLKEYFEKKGWQVTVNQIKDLRDDKSKAFQTRGLRNLAKAFGEHVREAGIEYCAINATGGYKAQIAIAVLMGQALGIPVYYKHERFDAIIPFPPMPVALDFSLWLKASGMFMILSRPNACEPGERFKEDWDKRFEPLVNRERIDGKPYLELSPMGQIFHETFCTRFRQSKAKFLPRKAMESERNPPNLGEHSYNRAREPIRRHLKNLSEERSYVRYCHSIYWNPDLPEASRFRLSAGQIEGIYSNGTWCVKFRVVTTADRQEDLSAVVADLNDWLGAGRA